MKSIGFDSRIHPTAIINNPDLVEVKNHVSIDIGVYCATQLYVGDYVHIAPYVCIIGGKDAKLYMDDYSGIAAGSKIVCASDDFKNSILNPQIPKYLKTIINKPITFEKYSCVGVNSVVMPGVTLKEGSVLGANSLLMSDTEDWSIYVGNPAKKIGYRNKEEIMKSVERLKVINEYKDRFLEFGKFGKDVLPEKALLKCISVGCVGNIAMAMNHLYFMKDKCKEIYIDFTKKDLSGWDDKPNPYDDILDQKLTDDYETVSCWGNELHEYTKDVLDDIRNTVKPYFKWHFKLQETVDNFVKEKGITQNTLGVHVRMSDMNDWHGSQFGYVYYENYKKAINSILKSNNIDKIFVASDNHETLQKLIKDYGDKIIYHPNISRTDNEHEYGSQGMLREKGHKRLGGHYNFYTPFIDALLLSKCGYMIGRKYSNFSTVSIMLGNMKYDNIISL